MTLYLPTSGLKSYINTNIKFKIIKINNHKIIHLINNHKIIHLK